MVTPTAYNMRHPYHGFSLCFRPNSTASAAAAAKSLQSCPTLSDPMDCSPAGSSIHGIFQTRVLEWGATAFSSTHAQSCPTLCDPMDCGPPGSSVHQVFQARILRGNLPNPGIEPTSSVSPALAVRFFTTEPPGKHSESLTFQLS